MHQIKLHNFITVQYTGLLTRDQFKDIFNSHFDEVRNYIYFRCGDAELATDIAQESFLKLWEKRLAIRLDKVKGLLYKIAGDHFISNYRKQKTEMNFRMNLKTDRENITPEDQIRFKELQGKYHEALIQLSEKQRIVFLMSRIDGLKYHEIAERLEISVKAVEKNMTKALQYLRHALNYSK